MKKHDFKFKIREQALYWWAAKEKYFKVVILKHVLCNEATASKNQYFVKIIDDYPHNDWTMSVQESTLSKIENPNKLMKDIIK